MNVEDDTTTAKIYPPRAARVPLSPLHRVSFNLVQPAQTQGLSLSNLSTTGLALLHADGLANVPAGGLFQGHLVFGNRGFPAKLKIVHRTGTVIGAVFEPDPRLTLIQDAIRDFFRVELAALSTMKVNSKFHKSEPDGDAHWIHGDTADLYYVTSSSGGTELLRFRMSFLGNYFEAGKERALTAGQIVDEDADREGPVKGSELLKDKALSPEALDLALKFLSNVPHLPAPHRDLIAAYFTAKQR